MKYLLTIIYENECSVEFEDHEFKSLRKATKFGKKTLKKYPYAKKIIIEKDVTKDECHR